MDRSRVTDVVVVVPGLLGSVLARDGREVWNVSPGAGWRGLISRLGSVSALRLGSDVGDDHPGDGVEPVAMMRGVHVVPGVWSPVRGYHHLVQWLRRTFTLDPPDGDSPGNLLSFPYDWRLSIRYNAGRLGTLVGPVLDQWRRARHPDAKIVYICHSMGGLVARYYLEVLGGADKCRTLVTMGTPYRGSLPALRHLVDGFPVGGREIGPLSALARSLPSLHQLTPVYDCVARGSELIRPRAAGLRGPQATLLADAERLHEEITAHAASTRSRYALYPIAGFGQPTPTSTRVDSGQLVWDTTIEGKDEGGDGRVPMLSSVPVELWDTGPVERAHMEKHGALQDHDGVREGIRYALTRERRFHRGPDDEAGRPLAVDLPEVVLAGSKWTIAVRSDDDRLALTATVTDVLSGVAVATRRGATLANQGGGRYGFSFAGLPAGLYEVAVSGFGTPTVTSHLIVWEEGDDVA